ncbi:MAG: hypothetical protein KDF67_05465 [Ottowia sp.]|nr:hypothetical protein [Ottowia sp.]
MPDIRGFRLAVNRHVAYGYDRFIITTPACVPACFLQTGVHAVTMAWGEVAPVRPLSVDTHKKLPVRVSAWTASQIEE